tara:strand:- start:240 stop:581 length:342 start_codon:yes stop_codon:yes gene_type:complete
MRVFVVFDDPKVQVAGDNDPLALDLVAHFLGMAGHDNDNVAPSVAAAPVEPALRSSKGSQVLALRDWRQSAGMALNEEVYARAVDEIVRPFRFSGTPKSQVSLLFEELHCPTG